MLRGLWLASALAAAGCASVDDIRQKPVAWSATYATTYDRMANCLVAAAPGGAVPMLYPDERRASVALVARANFGASFPIAEYEIVTTGPGEIRVSYRSIYGTAGVPYRERADRCARAA